MDALDMQQAAMQGVARYHEWKQKFLKDFTEAVEKRNLSLALALMPPQMRQMIQAQNPEEYKQMMSYLKGENYVE